MQKVLFANNSRQGQDRRFEPPLFPALAVYQQIMVKIPFIIAIAGYHYSKVTAQ